MLMDQPSWGDTLVGVGSPGWLLGEAVSFQSSGDKRCKLSPNLHPQPVNLEPSRAPEKEGSAISALVDLSDKEVVERAANGGPEEATGGSASRLDAD